jgi:hypothetical protein
MPGAQVVLCLEGSGAIDVLTLADATRVHSFSVSA